jgi:hypothetical protein
MAKNSTVHGFSFKSEQKRAELRDLRQRQALLDSSLPALVHAAGEVAAIKL